MKTKFITFLLTLFSVAGFCQAGDFSVSISYSYDQNHYQDDQMDRFGALPLNSNLIDTYYTLNDAELSRTNNFSINIGFQQRVSRNFFLESGLSYSNADQNFHFSGYYYYVHNNVSRMQNREISIPVVANFDVHFKPLSLYLGVGMNAALKMKWQSEDIDAATFVNVDRSSFENGYQLGSIVQAGTHINLLNKVRFKLGGRYLYSFANEELNNVYRLSAEAGVIFVLE